MSARTAGRFIASGCVAALLALLTTAPLGGPVAAKSPPATYVVQGVPGVELDVLVDGAVVESGVAPREVVGPLDIAPGSHTLAFRSPDWEVSKSVDVSGSQDVVVHWPADAADKPIVTVFDNDVSAIGSGKGRLTVAHTAVVPPADIQANGQTLFTNIANGEFITADVPATTYRVAVVPTGGGDPLLGPLDLTIEAGALTRVFAIGAPRDASMDAVVQVLPLPTSGGGTPKSVDTGSAGLVNPDGLINLARASVWALIAAVSGWWPAA